MAFLANFMMFLLLALIGGLGSAWYMIEAGTSITTQHVGPWATWTAEGNPDADPYTRAHVARSGRLPVTASSARYYSASTDSEGDGLDTDCEYLVEGHGPTAAWWSLAAYDGDGRLMKNPARRYAFNSADIMRATDGSFSVHLAREARAGNWLPVDGDRGLVLLLRVYRPRHSDQKLSGTAANSELPQIIKTGCR